MLVSDDPVVYLHHVPAMCVLLVHTDVADRLLYTLYTKYCDLYPMPVCRCPVPGCVTQVGAATGGEGLSALVNNAGHALLGPLEHIAIPDLRRQLDVNLIGIETANCSPAASPLTRETEDDDDSR